MLKKHIPSLFPLAIISLGIVCEDSLWKANCLSNSALWSFLIMAILLLIIARKSRFNFIALGILLFITGALISQANQISDLHFSKDPQIQQLRIKAYKIETSKKGYKIFAKVIGTDNHIQKTRNLGRLIIYTSSAPDIKLYDQYLIPASFKEIETFENPGTFDYGGYLNRLKIYHSSFQDPKAFKFNQEARLFQQVVRECKLTIAKYFKLSFLSEQSSSIINALLLGEKSSLDSQTKSLFINNGLAHLLAISGMHVGIIMLILQFLLQWLKNIKVRMILVLVGIWLYIILTGLQIPAARAGFMLSVYTFGIILQRNSKALNSIFFSALILICLNPNLLFQVSFQLSFTAMVSIFVFHHRIFQLLSFKTKIFQQLWQLTALNISVQILVLPLCIFYFEQIPIYSILNSLIAFPFIVVVMWLAIACFTFSGIVPVISHFLLKILALTLTILQEILLQLSNLPFALIEDVTINFFQVCFWTFAVLGFAYYFFHRTPKLNRAISCFIPLVMFSPLSAIIEKTSNKFVVYDLPNNLVIDIKQQENVLRFQDQLNIKSSSYYLPEISASQCHSFEEPYKQGNFNYENRMLTLKDTKIRIINDADNSVPSFNNFDLCIITSVGNSSIKLSQCQKVILARSLGNDENEHLTKYLKSIKKPFYSIASNGAFAYKI